MPAWLLVPFAAEHKLSNQSLHHTGACQLKLPDSTRLRAAVVARPNRKAHCPPQNQSHDRHSLKKESRTPRLPAQRVTKCIKIGHEDCSINAACSAGIGAGTNSYEGALLAGRLPDCLKVR